MERFTQFSRVVKMEIISREIDMQSGSLSLKFRSIHRNSPFYFYN